MAPPRDGPAHGRRAAAAATGALAVLSVFTPPDTGIASARTDDAQVVAVDPQTSLRVAPGWRLVQAHCGACHSLQLVTAQRGDRGHWLGLIRWMQRTQNLWDIPPDVEAQILDYLAANYAEQDWGRRPPLPAELMPPAG